MTAIDLDEGDYVAGAFTTDELNENTLKRYSLGKYPPGFEIGEEVTWSKAALESGFFDVYDGDVWTVYAREWKPGGWQYHIEPFRPRHPILHESWLASTTKEN